MTDADFFWKLIAGLSMLANFLGAIALLWNRVSGKSEAREIKNDPLNVREADRFITEKELAPLQEQVDGHADEIAELRKTAQDNFNKIKRDEAEGRSRLHTEINAVATDVSAIKSTVSPLTAQVAEITRSLGRVEGVLQQHN